MAPPKKPNSELLRDDDETGPEDQLEHLLAPFVLSSVRISTQKRTVSRTSGVRQTFRILGYDWRISELKLYQEDGKHLRKLADLSKNGSSATVPVDARALLTAVLETESEDRRRVPVRLDLIELDPHVPTRTIDDNMAIRLARAWLSLPRAHRTQRGAKEIAGVSLSSSDLRFPFQQFFELTKVAPDRARHWINQVATGDNALFSLLPRHWQQIAAELKVTRK